MQIKESVSIVTGGASGLGRATAQALVNKGAKVGYSQRPFGIGDPDGHFDYRNIGPGRSYQDFQLELKPPGFYVKVHGLRQWIDPESALGIAHRRTS